jgi:hypothetical protein
MLLYCFTITILINDSVPLSNWDVKSDSNHFVLSYILEYPEDGATYYMYFTTFMGDTVKYNYKIDCITTNDNIWKEKR